MKQPKKNTQASPRHPKHSTKQKEAVGAKSDAKLNQWIKEPVIKQLNPETNASKSTTTPNEPASQSSGRMILEKAFSSFSTEEQAAIDKQVAQRIKPYREAHKDTKGVMDHPTSKVAVWVAGLGVVFLVGWGALYLFRRATKEYKRTKHTLAA